MKKTLSVLIFTALAALGADVTGTWSGPLKMTRDGETRDDAAYMKLTQEGGKITGTVGPNPDRQWPIKTGSIDGSKIRFEVTPGEGGPPKIDFELTVDGDHLTGEMKAEHEGSKMTGKLDLKREK